MKGNDTDGGREVMFESKLGLWLGIRFGIELSKVGFEVVVELEEGRVDGLGVGPNKCS